MVTQATGLTQAIDDFVRRLSASLPVDVVILFGSQATGGATENSDIDLAVISPHFDGCSTWDRQEVIARATVGRAYGIAPVGFGSIEYAKPADSFLREIVRTGRVVYSKA